MEENAECETESCLVKFSGEKKNLSKMWSISDVC